MAKPKKHLPLRWILLALALGMLLFAYNLISGSSGLFNQIKLKRQLREDQRTIDSLTELKQALETEKQRLSADSSYLEKLARQELGMSKPKEKIYRFVNASASGDSSLNPPH